LLDTVANRIIVIDRTVVFDKMCNYEEYIDAMELNR